MTTVLFRLMTSFEKTSIKRRYARAIVRRTHDCGEAPFESQQQTVGTKPNFAALPAGFSPSDLYCNPRKERGQTKGFLLHQNLTVVWAKMFRFKPQGSIAYKVCLTWTSLSWAKSYMPLFCHKQEVPWCFCSLHFLFHDPKAGPVYYNRFHFLLHCPSKP